MFVIKEQQQKQQPWCAARAMLLFAPATPRFSCQTNN